MVAVPLIVLMVVTTANLLLQQNESHERTVSTNARNLEGAASQVLADAVNAETSVRGYAATGNRLLLVHYDQALVRLSGDRTSLREAAIAEGDGRQQQAMDATTGKILVQLSAGTFCCQPRCLSRESPSRAAEREDD